MPWDMVAGDGGVGANDFLLDGNCGVFGVGNGESRGDGDVLANWEAEDRHWGGEGEPVAGEG